MFDNLIDLNNTVTCYFMYLIGQSSQGGRELALGIFFSTELTHLMKTKKTLSRRTEYGAPRNCYLLTVKRCGRSLHQRGKAMEQHV